MGMFNDNVSANRTGWTYSYFGSQLLKAATKLHKEYSFKEESSRNTVAGLMKDMSVSHNDPRVEDAKREIVKYGTLKEQCLVFKHEFTRNPDKEYHLGLGDVTFFGLAEDTK